MGSTAISCTTGSRLRVACLALGLIAACEDAPETDSGDGGFGITASSASESRYVDNEDGTVADAQTWLTWQQTVSPDAFTWDDAKTYCTWLLLESQGWRLPTVKELGSMVDTRYTPTLDTGSFPDAPAERFWSSTRVPGRDDFVWNIDFESGEPRGDAPNTPMRVRCVRGEERTAK